MLPLPLLRLLLMRSAHQFFLLRALRRSLTSSKELCACMPSRTSSSVCCRGCGRDHRVATASHLHDCTRVRQYVRLHAVLAATEAVCIGYRPPVDVPVKKSALVGVYMSRPKSSTVPKRNLSVCAPVGLASGANVVLEGNQATEAGEQAMRDAAEARGLGVYF